MTPEIEKYIQQEALSRYSSPYGKDTPETHAFIDGLTKGLEIAAGFAEWSAKEKFTFSIKNELWVDNWLNKFTTSELLTIYLKQLNK